MRSRDPSEVGSPFPGYVVAGGHVSAVTLEDTIRFTEEAILGGRRELVTTTNAYAATLARKDARLAQAFRASALVIPDGFYVTRVGRRRASRPVGRVRGTDTLVAFAELAARNGYTSYFYGGAPGISDKVIAELQRRSPGFTSVGAHSPPYRPLSPEEDEADVQRINDANPDVLWVGLGCPKQEIWAHEHRPRLNARVIVPVGAAFDFLAGTIKPAPRWVQSIGMEWLWRFAAEPRRLWRRVLIHGPWFVALVVRESLTGSWRKTGSQNQ